MSCCFCDFGLIIKVKGPQSLKKTCEESDIAVNVTPLNADYALWVHGVRALLLNYFCLTDLNFPVRFPQIHL